MGVRAESGRFGDGCHAAVGRVDGGLDEGVDTLNLNCPEGSLLLLAEPATDTLPGARLNEELVAFTDVGVELNLLRHGYGLDAADKTDLVEETLLVEFGVAEDADDGAGTENLGALAGVEAEKGVVGKHRTQDNGLVLVALLLVALANQTANLA